MDKRIATRFNPGPEAEFARGVKAAIAGTFAAALLLIGAYGDNGTGLVKDAAAATAGLDGGYLPAQFPSPEGAPEPHVEAF